MNIFVKIWFVTLMGISVPLISGMSPSANGTIVVSSSQNAYAIATPIAISVTFANSTDQDMPVFISAGRKHAEFFYAFVLKDDKGNTVKASRYAEDLAKRDVRPISRILKTLKPGETITEEVDLTKLFLIAMPGVYTLYAEKSDPQGSGTGVKSNKITITVTQ